MNILAPVIVGGSVGAILAYYFISKSKSTSADNLEGFLVECFGAPVDTEDFSLNEAKQWLNDRGGQLKSGSKAFIMKANQESLKSIGVNLQIGNDPNNYIVIAITTADGKSMLDKVLIKYTRLDRKLESMLDNGNGMLVVEG